ncbi:glycoside hydrolase [Phlegmacium glaucopus]|nr:glycoside hydrolase [Phlegmacium glaucopus]
MRTFSLLPLGVLFVCFEAALRLGLVNVSVEAKQQCRLRFDNSQVPLRSSPNIGSPGPSTTGHSPTSTSPSGASAALASPTPFNYGTDKIRGVNLGGWLVLEPWITPSIFENTNNDNVLDEFTLGQLVDQKTALTMLEQHWDTWITEDDFKAISAAGLNHVRIPIGYWSIPLTSSDTNTSTSTAPYIPGAWTYLLRALTWARNHSVHVIIDLHGAPGSQNGYDNSGQRTSDPIWGVTPANITRTIDTLRFIVENVDGMVDVIELLNEAAGFKGDDWAAAIRQFWLDGYDVVRQAAGAGIKVMIGDAFLGVQSWTNFLVPPRGQGVLMDFHEYQIFSDLELNRTFDDHVSFACGYQQSLSSFSSSNIWTVIGEWSNAPTDCAKWLNGRGIGARWDNTYYPGPTSMYHGSCTNFTGSYVGFSQDYKAFLRKYWEVQVEIGENIQGWVFWTWKVSSPARSHSILRSISAWTTAKSMDCQSLSWGLKIDL